MARYEWQTTRAGRRYVRIEGSAPAPAPATSDARIAVEPDTPDFVAKVEEPVVEAPVEVVESEAPVAVPTTLKPKSTTRRRSSPKKKSDG